jgi:hypothetical protein
VKATCLDLEKINQLYRNTTREEDYVNPTADGVLIWRSITLRASVSDTGLENWQQILHEVSTRRCTGIECVVRWVGTKLREPPTFHGLNDLEELLTNYDEQVLENHRLLSLDISLKETFGIWWGIHKEIIQYWYRHKRLLHIRFGIEQGITTLQKYDR